MGPGIGIRGQPVLWEHGGQVIRWTPGWFVRWESANLSSATGAAVSRRRRSTVASSDQRKSCSRILMARSRGCRALAAKNWSSLTLKRQSTSVTDGLGHLDRLGGVSLIGSSAAMATYEIGLTCERGATHVQIGIDRQRTDCQHFDPRWPTQVKNRPLTHRSLRWRTWRDYASPDGAGCPSAARCVFEPEHQVPQKVW
jgi:hypothetical protein